MPTQKDCTNNEQVKEQVQNNNSFTQKTVPSKIGSFLKTFASLLVLLITPNFLMLFTYTIINLSGSPSQLLDFVSSKDPEDVLKQIWWPYIVGNYEVWTIIGMFVSVEAVLMIILPGHRYTGSVTPKGNVIHYKNNGLLAFLLTIIAFMLLVYYEIFNPSIIYDNFMHLIGALNLLGLSISVILFIKGKFLPSSTDVTDAGLISGFFGGMELHPRILGLDIKLFIKSRFGMMGWALLLMSYACKQYLNTGEISDSMGVAVSLQIIYIMKFFYWEQGYTRTIGIAHDKAGFYTVSILEYTS